jgi:adenosylhomocysteine nucleosidase
MKIAIMSAMHEELNRIIKKLDVKNVTKIGNRKFYEGKLNGCEVVAVFSHWGKVAAAMTTTILITKFDVDKIIFTGVAGGISENINVGDVVIGKRFFQHDMNASPMITRYEIPLLKSNFITSAQVEIDMAFEAAKETLNDDFLELFTKEEISKFCIHKPQVIIGDIASGDEFVSDESTRNRIKSDLPSVVCVEMEGAAVAQVCSDFNIPFVVIRTISDSANEASHIDFTAFIENVASLYSEKMVERMLSLYN